MRPARRGPRRPAGAALVLRLVLATIALTAPSRAQARPVTVEDLLQREDLGQAVVTPGGRFLLVERRGPYAAAPRFDQQLFNPLFRTRLLVADLAHPGRLRPLVHQDPQAGYQLGPPSPDGVRALVYRLRGDDWSAGVVRLASGRVRWLPITPELPGPERTLQWTSPTTLVALARAPGDRPYELRWMDPAPTLAARWARTARGGLAVSAVGSGRYLGLRPPARPRSLVTIDAATGAVRTLAHGAFTDLEASPDGRRLAALEAAEEIPLSADHPVQGAYGIATRRQRLLLADLATGRVRHRVIAEDLLGVLSWRPDSQALLVYGRADGAPWSAGRLLQVDTASGQPHPLAPSLRPAVERRPETIYAGWWGQDPLVFARGPTGERPDWWRLAPDGPVRLTAGLAQPPRRGLVAAPGALLLIADGAAWRIDRQGQATRLTTGPAAAPPERPAGVPARAAFAVPQGDTLAAILPTSAGGRLVRLGPDGQATAGATIAPGETLLAAGPRGALVSTPHGGGAETLAWRTPSGHRTPLARLNTRFAGIDTPQAVPVPHRGPNGEPLTSWVLLPARSVVPGRPPPLIVEAYLGTVYGASPVARLYADGPLVPTAALLGHGYAVLLPSLPVRRPSSGPGDRLADQVLAVVDVAAALPALKDRIDPARLGLWGHSFGGYTVLQTLTETPRFRAAVAQAGMSDLASQWGARTVGDRTFGDRDAGVSYNPGWTEDLQGDMRAPPWADPARYLANSPLFHAERITTPLMLVHGDLDQFSITQAEEMFTALARQDKDAVLVTYFGEKHLYASPATWRDLYARLFAWFDSHLEIALGRRTKAP